MTNTVGVLVLRSPAPCRAEPNSPYAIQQATPTIRLPASSTRRSRQPRSSSMSVSSVSSLSSTRLTPPALYQRRRCLLHRRRPMNPPIVMAPAEGELCLRPTTGRQRDLDSATPSTCSGCGGCCCSHQKPYSWTSIGSNEMLAMELPNHRRPVQINADPRVYKGSVFANRRIATNNARKAENVDKREKRYRVGVIREQLSSILPPMPLPKMPTTSTGIPKVGRSEQITRRFLPDLHQSTSGASIDKNKFPANTRFSPLKNKSEVARGDYPSKVVVNFGDKTKSTTRRGEEPAIRARIISPTATPPSSTRYVYPIVNSGVQTEDDFDEKFDELVKELANSAITMALFQIEGEDQIHEMRKKAHETQRRLQIENRRQSDINERWRLEIIEKNRQLESWKKREAEAREAQRVALETCQTVTQKTLENIKTMEEKAKKSVGLDTREMNRFCRRIALVTTELEKDFFPWIFQRAERLFRNRMLRNELDDCTLNNYQTRRERAKQRLIQLNTSLL